MITDWNSFHDVFSMTFGFFRGYGRNMDAWIDCMSDIDSPENGMTKIWIEKTDTLVIEIRNSERFKERCGEIYLELLECSAFVNFRKLEYGEQAMIAISAS